MSLFLSLPTIAVLLANPIRSASLHTLSCSWHLNLNYHYLHPGYLSGLLTAQTHLSSCRDYSKGICKPTGHIVFSLGPIHGFLGRLGMSWDSFRWHTVYVCASAAECWLHLHNFITRIFQTLSCLRAFDLTVFLSFLSLRRMVVYSYLSGFSQVVSFQGSLK